MGGTNPLTYSLMKMLPFSIHYLKYSSNAKYLLSLLRGKKMKITYIYDTDMTGKSH